MYSKNAESEFMLLAVLKNRTSEEEARLQTLARNDLDYGWIGGQLLHHRLSGYFYFGLGEQRRELLNSEFLRALECIVQAQAQQAKEINKLILPILGEFDEAGIRYSALKGLVFNASLYQPGERRSNDSDILVLEEDLDKLDPIIRKHGYIQTFYWNGEYKEATRKEKMIQRMNYHDLVPYLKLVESPFISRHDIDVNFHFDSKENDITKEVFEQGTHIYANGQYEVRGLPWETHMAQLCAHFYREGSSSLWSSGRRDVVLYKLVDAANTFRLVQDEQQLIQWVDLMKRLNLDKACFYTLHYISEFYPRAIPTRILAEVRPSSIEFVNEIEVSGEDRIVKRQSSFKEDALNLTYKRKPS